MNEQTTQVSPAVSDLSDRELDRLIEQLDEEERTISRHRASLHQRIDFLRGGGAGFTTETDEQIATLSTRERAVSEERKALHLRIDELRTERDRRVEAA